MEALIAGTGYVNFVAERQAAIADGPFLNDHVATFTLTKYRPTSDTAAGNWTSSLDGALYAACNETTRDDANYAQSGANPSNDIMGLGFAAPGVRPVNTNHTIRYVLYAAGTLDMTVLLKQAGATRKSWVHSPAPTSPTLYERVLTEGEAATLTPGDALELTVEAG